MRIQCKMFQGMDDDEEEENPLEKLEREMKEFKEEYGVTKENFEWNFESHLKLHLRHDE